MSCALLAMEDAVSVQFGPNDEPHACCLHFDETNMTVSDRQSPSQIIEIPKYQILCMQMVNNATLQLVVCGHPRITITFASEEKMKKWYFGLSNTSSQCSDLIIDDFEQVACIGKGVSGTVILAKYKKNQQLYALKSIPKDRIKTMASSQRVIRERNYMLQAIHPFITRLYSSFQTCSHLYFVLEYVPGGDLNFHLNRNINLSSYQIQLYLAELVLALRHLHLLGIVFRDLKPENILIGSDGHLKLADFGFAKDLVANSTTNSFCGTYEYLAPETIKGQSSRMSVDWWALGIIAHRLILGRLPFHSDNLCRLYSMISNGKLYLPKSLDKDAKSFITQLLQTDPSQRLGCGPKGEDEILTHPFFDNIDWNSVYEKKYSMEFKPQVPSDGTPVNFDPQLTCVTDIQSEQIDSDDDYRIEDFEFEGFKHITSLSKIIVKCSYI